MGCLLAGLSLRELEAEARGCLEESVFDYFAGGADDEVTVRANEAAFARIGIVPRILRAQTPRLTTTLLGTELPLPVVIAPTPFHRLAHPDGELATARAAAAGRTLMVVSMAATARLEEIAVAGDGGPGLWFQLYVQSDLGFTEALVRRAEKAGCRALVVSADNPRLPMLPGFACENMRDPEDGQIRPIRHTADLAWKHLDWLRQITTLPIVLKGVNHPADARMAVKRGIDGIIVSNHGGRQLDTVPAAIDLLPAIADAVAGRVPLLLDGGVRRGTDVVKALARGAAAVAVGRPVVWGLAVAGEAGVRHVLETLRDELTHALAQSGCSVASEVTLTFPD
ncbi:alpha-hydroxy-acid oxidizing protein [Allorhizocola rhizosphaerae]|uniref:alpha-hydroxy-acid oxidizing protein n=1 Tax=Allorhizocola rhizosphaerae TaxID=1872709 RepID=UPI001FEC8D86|nr:alpha-hydroxy-acid oxidizing protein [Allorhizocola rhizosphaerae]